MKVGTLEKKIEDEFGVKVQIAGSDDSYLCDNNLSLARAHKKDQKKLKGQESLNVKEDKGGQDMSDFEGLIEKVVKEFRSDPRNKVFAPQELLIASALEELGKEISFDELKSLVDDYESGSLDEDQEEIYDGIVYCCAELARKCFGEEPDDEDEEVDYEISWIENGDGSIAAEIRPDCV